MLFEILVLKIQYMKSKISNQILASKHTLCVFEMMYLRMCYGYVHEFILELCSAAEYYDETFQLPSGSSVIIKRVPKGSVRPDL